MMYESINGSHSHDVVQQLPRFIDKIYNQELLHSALGYLPPEEYENVREAA